MCDKYEQVIFQDCLWSAQTRATTTTEDEWMTHGNESNLRNLAWERDEQFHESMHLTSMFERSTDGCLVVGRLVGLLSCFQNLVEEAQ